jgi:hypothetical protein
MPVVRFGNTAPRHPDGEGNQITESTITEANVPDSYTHAERVHNVTDVNGWAKEHSMAPPVWVESDDPKLEAALSAIYDCPIGQPGDWA